MTIPTFVSVDVTVRTVNHTEAGIHPHGPPGTTTRHRVDERDLPLLLAQASAEDTSKPWVAVTVVEA